MTTATVQSRIAVNPDATHVNEELRLSEVISALSYALDIVEGQPEGHAMRSCLIGMRIADEIRLSAEEKAALFYALLLKDLGCSSNAAKMCWLFKADDISVKRDVKLVNWTSLLNSGMFALKHALPNGGWFQRLLHVCGMSSKGEETSKDLVKVRCERGADITRMLGFPEATAQAILGLDEHWDGAGHPLGMKGDEIPLLGRICCLSQTVEVFHAEYGLSAAIDVANQRKGKWFDPTLVKALRAVKKDKAFWANLSSNNVSDELKRIEPQEHVRMVDDKLLDDIAVAFSSVVDAKSPWTYKHSEGVAEISVGIGNVLGLSKEHNRQIFRAGLLHDIGKLGVSNLVLDKNGKLTDDEYGQMKKHTIYTQRILERVPCFQELASFAAAHHERLDGRGYHLGLKAEEIPLEARILLVADICDALAAKRPYRDCMPTEKILSIFAEERGAGMCPEVLDAFLFFQEKNDIICRIKERAATLEDLLEQVQG